MGGWKTRVEEIGNLIVEAQTREAADPAVWARDGDGDGESAEVRSLRSRADMGSMVSEIIANRNVSGANAELQAHFGVTGGQIPIAMLAVESRVVDAPDSAGAGTQPVMSYRFGPSIAEVGNVRRVGVPSGQHTFASFTSGAAATRPAAAATNADADPVLRGELLTPHRVQSNTSINLEDLASFAGLGEAIAAHLRTAVVAGLDQQAVSDNGGFFDPSSGPLGAAPGAASATTFAQYMAMLTGNVDGRHALTDSEITIIVNADIKSDMAVLFRNAQAQEAVDEILNRRGRLVVSAAIPAPVSNVSSILVVKGSQPASVQAIWPGLEIRDIYSSSASGQVKFSSIALAAFTATMPSAYAWAQANSS